MARAIARGVYEATALPVPDALTAWRDRYPDRARSLKQERYSLSGGDTKCRFGP